MSFDFSDWISDLRRRQVFRVAAIYAAVVWAAVEVADVVVPAFGLPDWVLTAVVILAILGFPVAVVLAWIFDVGKDGIVRTKPGSATGIVTILLSVSLLVLCTAGMVWLLAPGLEEGDAKPLRVSEAAANSVAVLPFENLSANPDNEYFSDGLTDTLLHMLASVEQLEVAARTSSFAFKNQGRDIREIAAAIGVAYVLEGSVQRVADRIRVTAQLIRADDGYRVWSKSFDDVIEDVFAIQDDIAGEVASKLAASIPASGTRLRPEGVDTSNFEAYDLFLQARENRHRASIEKMTQSIQLLQRAVVLDPDFLDAKAELALNLAALKSFQPGPELQDAVALLEQVLATDPEHAKARMLRAFIGLGDSLEAGDTAGMNEHINEIERVFAKAPGETDIAIIAAQVLMNIGQPERALPIHEALLANDPLNVPLHLAVARNYERLGRFDEAGTFVERALEINPQSVGAHLKAATLAQQVGDGMGYIRQMVRASELDPLNWETHAYTAIFLYHIGLVEEGDHFRDKLQTLARNSPMSHYTNLIRSVASEDGETIYRLVGDRLRERGGTQCCSYWDGLEILIRQAALDGRLPETIALIDKHRPGFSDLNYTEMPLAMLSLRLRQINALRGDRSLEEMNAFVERAEEEWRAFPGNNGQGMAASPRVHAAVLVMRGDVEAAAEVVLNGIFSDARIHFQDWREYFAQPCFDALVREPRVRAELERWDEEERQLRNTARALF